MSFRLVIELDGAAVAKGRHHSQVRTTKDGSRAFAHQYPDGKTVKYEAQLRFAGQVAMREQQPDRLPVIEACRVTVDVYLLVPQTPPGGKGVRAAMIAGALRPTKKPDVDNYLKTVGDSLNGVVWKDDSVIAEATVRKWWSERAYLVITVEAIQPPVLDNIPQRRAAAGDLFVSA